MAYGKPCSISDLCKLFNLDFYELSISCVFCRKQLEDIDKWCFMNRDLQVVWKKEFPFALCLKCIEVRVIVDLLRSFELSASAKYVEEETGHALGDLKIRCYGCWKPLTESEKLFHVEERKKFEKIANQWRGICTNCYYLPGRLVYYFFSISGRTQSPLPRLTWGFDRRPADLSDSEASSWTTTSASYSNSSSSSISSGRRDDNQSDAESDGQAEVLI
ncbi:E6 [Tursiops truncatus papillomavirus 6]|uniref:Protein E6 n=1 Tax=Tursiops truncatus papillomavirus 6 TaxID=1144382 RepID=H6UYP6_PSPV|nr:E6 [Tursiops truncatus papillomavirus 6]